MEIRLILVDGELRDLRDRQFNKAEWSGEEMRTGVKVGCNWER